MTFWASGSRIALGGNSSTASSANHLTAIANDIKLKNNLMPELSSSIKEDVKQINDVEVVVTESMNSGKVLLEDILTDDKPKMTF